MRKMCQSHTVQKKESISDEWFSSLQYLNVKIDDLMISNSFLDSASEFRGVNDATINALGIKDKDSKTVTATGNFIRIDNGEPEPMLCLAYIIPTFSKASEVEDLLKEDQDQASTNSSSPNSEEDLKKSV
ncbi:hypothetical protein GLOIN_2v1481897 [Rhizophagus irregularis DAOM 181602=DAOM 197198]|nr:hypothetical protein GLOIN_2v1481897 [Rhizophagus irregularis DAOM 181602=DAOM 197198]